MVALEKVQLDVRDLGGHLDFTFESSGWYAFQKGYVKLLLGLLLLVLYLYVFRFSLRLVRGKYLPAGLPCC